MYIASIPNRNSPPAVLLRESRREGKRVIKKTLANLSDWPKSKVDALRALLKGEYEKISRQSLIIEHSLPHGHVQAILGTMRKIGLDEILYSKPMEQREAVLAMIAEQLIHPTSKLGYSRILPTTSLLNELGLKQPTEDDLYKAMDWLYERQPKIEKKLAKIHLSDGAFVLYDITSSYYEGSTCPLATFGYNRDKKKGKRIIVYGMLTNDKGCPIAVDVYAGRTTDSTTVIGQVEKIQQRFGLKQLVLVGDRGMLTQTNIEALIKYPGIGWISALCSDGVRNLVQQGALQLSLLDERDLAEITSDLYPGERLIVCYNPFMAEKRKHKREELLSATEEELNKIANGVKRRKKKLYTAEKIALMTGRIVNKYKMGKHFELKIGRGKFQYKRKTEQIRMEASLDGIYVIRTSEPESKLTAEDTVRRYKSLCQVEKMFRTLKGVEILVRPIRHRLGQRVRAHIFLCMLAYYMEWHMRQKLAPILFTDEEAETNRMTRHPVRPAVPSLSVQIKKATKRTVKEGIEVNSFTTLLEKMATRVLNFCRIKNSAPDSVFPVVTEPTLLQKKALALLEIRTQ